MRSFSKFIFFVDNFIKFRLIAIIKTAFHAPHRNIRNVPV